MAKVKKRFPCVHCKATFSRDYDRKKHEGVYHAFRRMFKCSVCTKKFSSYEQLKTHQIAHLFKSARFVLYRQAFRKHTVIFRGSSFRDDITSALSKHTLEEIQKLIVSETVEKRSVSYAVAATVEFMKLNPDGDIGPTIDIVLTTERRKYYITEKPASLQQHLHAVPAELSKKIGQFQENGSGWQLKQISYLDVHITKISDIRGGCHIPLTHLKSKRGLLNIQNEDQQCMLYCIAAGLYSKGLPAAARTSPEKYQKYLKLFNTDGIQFPLSVDDITRLEEQNTHLQIAINVFTEEDGKIYPQRLHEPEAMTVRCSHNIINTLLISGESEDGVQKHHFVLITDMSKFLGKVYTTESARGYSTPFVCKYCFAFFRTQPVYQRHETACFKGKGKAEATKIFMKEDAGKLQFEKPHLKYPHIFSAFVDFESIALPVTEQGCYTCQEKKVLCSHLKTTKLYSHQAVNYSFIVVDRYDQIYFEETYTGENAAGHFIDTLVAMEEPLKTAVQQEKYMVFTDEDEKRFKAAKCCHICSNPLKNKKNQRKVRDHCHVTGRFLGAAHNSCNMNRRERSLMKIFAHNFSGYDSHFIIKNLSREGVRDVDIIPRTSEKFMAITINNIFTLVDSLNFLPASLDKLVKNLPSDHAWSIVKQSRLMRDHPDDEERFQHLFKKWKYPYEYGHKIADLENCTELPAPEQFYNTLTEEHIKLTDYQESQQIFKKFNCANLKEYMELYCFLDTVLLAEVFATFRRQSLVHFGVDPNNFISLPGMGFECFLKYSEVELDYITDPEIWDMLQSNLRGGLSFASQRYEEATFFREAVTPDIQRAAEDPYTSIIYIDANNLYGTCQTYPLPYAEFRFLDKTEIDEIDWEHTDFMKDYGYFAEVTLDYPVEIRESTADFPLCPENVTITDEMLSPYQKDVLKTIYGKTSYKAKKLTATFNPREKIVLHGLNLQFYLEQGMILREVHRVIGFLQKPIMKDWVEFCTLMRSQATDEFTKTFWKLIVNSVYGKTIESILLRKKVVIARSAEQLAHLMTRPNYERHIIIADDLVVVIMTPEKAKIIRPYYIGYSILEISKYIMYYFFYNILKPHFQHGMSLLYMDTDSFVLKVTTHDIIEDLKELKENFDFSNLNHGHPLYDPKNKAQLFKFKEEFQLRPISRICALKSKVYSMEVACTHTDGMNAAGRCSAIVDGEACKMTNVESINRNKGVKRSTTAKLKIDAYINCLEEVTALRTRQYQIMSANHSLSTVEINKISLSSYSDKRYIKNCGIHSEPFSEQNNPACSICSM